MPYLELRVQEKKFISQEIRKLKDDDQLLLVAFGITNPFSIAEMNKDWKTSDTAIKAVGRGVTSSSKIRPMDYGGCLTLIKISEDQNKVSATVLAEIDLVMPMGLCFDDVNKQILIGSAFGVLTLKQGLVGKPLHHNLFSQVHGISKGKGGFFAACTNTDSIVNFKITEEGKVEEIWKWIAPDNGYEFDTRGDKRFIDTDKDYSQIDEGGTRTHTTHVNSVLEYDEFNVLATLFHQDELVMINKKYGTTQSILKDMTNLHHIKKIPNGGFIFSATRKNETVILDEKFEIKKIIKGDFDWVQDSEVIKDNFILADNNHSRLVIVSKEYKEIGEITWKEDIRRVSNMIRVSGSEAKDIFI